MANPDRLGSGELGLRSSVTVRSKRVRWWREGGHRAAGHARSSAGAGGRRRGRGGTLGRSGTGHEWRRGRRCDSGRVGRKGSWGGFGHGRARSFAESGRSRRGRELGRGRRRRGCGGDRTRRDRWWPGHIGRGGWIRNGRPVERRCPVLWRGRRRRRRRRYFCMSRNGGWEHRGRRRRGASNTSDTWGERGSVVGGRPLRWLGCGANGERCGRDARWWPRWWPRGERRWGRWVVGDGGR